MKTETTDSSSYIYVFHMLSIQNRHVNSTHYADTKWEMGNGRDGSEKENGWLTTPVPFPSCFVRSVTSKSNRQAHD